MDALNSKLAASVKPPNALMYFFIFYSLEAAIRLEPTKRAKAPEHLAIRTQSGSAITGKAVSSLNPMV